MKPPFIAQIWAIAPGRFTLPWMRESRQPLVRSASAAVVVVVLAGTAMSCLTCRAEPPALPPPRVALIVPPASGTDPVVALVGQTPIYASHVVAQMHGGQPAREALKDLIDLEVLLSRARAARLDEGADAENRRKVILAQALLRKDFETKTTASQIPLAAIKPHYEQRKRSYVHPRLVEVTILDLIVFERHGAHRAAKAAVQARELAALIAARRDWTKEAFSQLASDPKWRARNLRLTKVFQDDSGPYSKEFAQAVMSLPPGRVSAMVKDEDGYHVGLVLREIPPRDVSLAEAREELAFFLHPAWQRLQFTELTDRLIAQSGAQIFIDRLVPAASQ